MEAVWETLVEVDGRPLVRTLNYVEHNIILRIT